LCMLRLFASEQVVLVVDVYGLLFVREADAPVRLDFSQMLLAPGARLRAAWQLRLCTVGSNRSVSVVGMAKSLLMYGTQSLLRRLGMDILIRGRVKRYEDRVRARWSWPAMQLRLQARQQRALQASTAERDMLKAEVNELMAKERAKDGG